MRGASSGSRSAGAAGAAGSVGAAGAAGAAGAGVAIAIEGLSVAYSPGVPALKDIDLVVPKGDYLAILGPNGGGKSTLFKAILGLVRPTRGRIVVGPGERLGYVPQFSSMESAFPISVLEVVLSAFLRGGPHPLHRFKAEEKEKAMAYIEELGLEGLENRQIGELSGGERQKLLIARALAGEPTTLLLDEPVSGVDPASRERIYGVLDRLAASATLLLVTHDTLAVSSRVRHIACLNERLFYHGDPEIRSGTLGALYGCPVDLIAHGVPHRVLGERHV